MGKVNDYIEKMLKMNFKIQLNILKGNVKN